MTIVAKSLVNAALGINVPWSEAAHEKRNQELAVP